MAGIYAMSPRFAGLISYFVGKESVCFRKGMKLVNLTLPDSQFGQSVEGGVWVWVNGFFIYIFIAAVEAS